MGIPKPKRKTSATVATPQSHRLAGLIFMVMVHTAGCRKDKEETASQAAAAPVPAVAHADVEHVEGVGQHLLHLRQADGGVGGGEPVSFSNQLVRTIISNELVVFNWCSNPSERRGRSPINEEHPFEHPFRSPRFSPAWCTTPRTPSDAHGRGWRRPAPSSAGGPARGLPVSER